MRITNIRPRFVEYIPDQLEDGVLYISERFRTCSHNCCCGCGEEVVTPLSPAEWRLTKEGNSVSLWPSVGNWDYACRSHYVISRNQVKWAAAMNSKQIARVQQRDLADLNRMVNLKNQGRFLPSGGSVPQSSADTNKGRKKAPSVLTTLVQWFWGKLGISVHRAH
jgi:hypothetical protein